ncbi:MAG: DedA family protein [Bacteroidales bacterium]|nr:DedA family protein [Bacteroidales bacterium]
MESLIKLGYLGLFLSSFLASTIIPISSEIVLSGLIYLGSNVWICIFVATAGNFLGGLTTYYLGYLGKWEWVEKYMKTPREKIERFQTKIQKYGVYSAFFAWLPFVGDLIALGLGFMRINPIKVSVLMLVGRFVRFVVSGLAIAQIL